jgi:K+/H+ antiporter YhaU regulatory subunit KhtT
VAIYYRQESDEAPDARLVGLDNAEQQQVRQMMNMMSQMSAEQLAQFAAQVEQMVAQVPPENQDMAEVLIEIVRERQVAAGSAR